jgi:hypothetical protein
MGRVVVKDVGVREKRRKLIGWQLEREEKHFLLVLGEIIIFFVGFGSEEGGQAYFVSSFPN